MINGNFSKIYEFIFVLMYVSYGSQNISKTYGIGYKRNNNFLFLKNRFLSSSSNIIGMENFLFHGYILALLKVGCFCIEDNVYMHIYI